MQKDPDFDLRQPLTKMAILRLIRTILFSKFEILRLWFSMADPQTKQAFELKIKAQAYREMAFELDRFMDSFQNDFEILPDDPE